MATYKAYSDGACTKLGIGQCGGFIYKNPSVIDFAWSMEQFDTTNNQMELLGAIITIMAFSVRYEEGDKLILHTDSQYVQKGITEWIHNWKARNWRSTSGPVANRDLWELLDELKDTLVNEYDMPVVVKWVRGHNGNFGNEYADYLASRINCFRDPDVAIKEARNELKKVFLKYGDTENDVCPKLETLSIFSNEGGFGKIEDTIEMLLEEETIENLFSR